MTLVLSRNRYTVRILCLLMLFLLPALAACGGSTGGTSARTGPTSSAGSGITAGTAQPQPTVQAGASGTGDKRITIGSKNFTEQVILGELYAQALEAKGYQVTRKLNLGSVQVLDQALVSGQIDMYPEYTGTSLENVMKYKGAPPRTPAETYALVKKFYAKRQPAMTVLQPAGFNNTNAVVVTRKVADQYKLNTIGDLEKASPKLVFASFSEFQQRPDSFPTLKKNYPGINFKKIIIANSIGLRYQALQQGSADVTVGFTTDGQIASQNLVLLKDEKNIWPFYYPAPILRTDYLKQHSGVDAVLNAVSSKLDAANMQQMNAQVDIEHKDAADVASKFLKDNGLK